MAIKVFYLNDCEWWAGESLAAVKAEYLRVTGLAEDEAFDNPYELPDDSMEKLMFTDDDGLKMTFAEQLDRLIMSGARFPCFFATTEF